MSASKHDWGLIFAGVALAAAGFFCMLAPGLTIVTIAAVVGAFFLVAGVFDIISYIRPVSYTHLDVYKRQIVCCVVIPGALEGCWDALAGRGLSNVSHAVWGGAGGAVVVSPVYSLFSLAVFLASVMFFLVASMRASIYGRLGPGFQVPRLWAMMRHDMKGLLRVLGLSIVLAIVPAVVTGGHRFAFVCGRYRRGGVWALLERRFA